MGTVTVDSPSLLQRRVGGGRGAAAVAAVNVPTQDGGGVRGRMERDGRTHWQSALRSSEEVLVMVRGWLLVCNTYVRNRPISPNRVL